MHLIFFFHSMTDEAEATSIQVFTVNASKSYKQNENLINLKFVFCFTFWFFSIFSMTDQTEATSIQVSTVDAFQGGERGVIILSCVKTHSTVFMDNDK